jgi:crotonobetaine/carnitine-CoA ligase
LPALLERQAMQYGDRRFVATTSGVERSFVEVRDAAASWAGLLGAVGIGRGDRVAAIAGNRIELVELLLGCAWMGAVAVPINTALRGGQIHHALTNSGAKALIIETEHLDALARVPPPASLERVWLLDRERTHRAHGYVCEPLPAAGDQAPAAEVRPGDAAAILYEAGRTGVAKGVCCPHAQLYWAGVLGSEFLSVGHDDVCLTALPLFHAATISSFCQALVAGASWVFAPRFMATRYWRLAAEHHATRTYLLPAMVAELLSAPVSRDDRSHAIAVALAPATPAPLHDRFHARFGVRLREGYDSTETNHVTGRAGDPVRPGLLGRAVDEFELAVLDGNDCPVGPGVPGELVVRPRQPFSMASGYHAMPAATVAAWRNLWFHTDERVVCDAEGWYRFAERTNDAIRRGGENVSSSEVEQALCEHPAVAAVAVYPVENEVMAAIVLEPGSDTNPLELVRFCEPRIAGFAIPRFIDFVPALPLADDGSVRKTLLRDRGVSHATWDRHRAGQRFARR